MRTNGHGRTRRVNDLGQALFGSAGWLFADLLLAIAMVFLVANTVGAHSPHHRKPPLKPHPSATPIPALDLKPVKIWLTVNPQGLASRSPTAMASVSNQVLHAPRIASRSAGLVLLFAGNNQGDPLAYSLDSEVSTILSGLGRHNFVFQRTVYRDFLEVGSPPTVVELNIYLFKTQSGSP